MEPYAPYPLNLLRDWLHRHRWKIRIALWIVLVAWLGPWVHARLTTEPVNPVAFEDFHERPNPLVAKPPANVDATLKLINAISQLNPPSATVPTTAPAGYVWVEMLDPSASYTAADDAAGTTFIVDPSVAYCGEWDPEHRANLTAAIKYLDAPATIAAMKKVAEFASQPFAISAYQSAGLGQFRSTTKHFVARSRYRFIEHNDFDGMLADLETAMQLGVGCGNDKETISTLVDIAIRSTVLGEIRFTANSHSLTDEQLVAFKELAGRYSINWRQKWLDKIEFERRYSEFMLDGAFTDDGNGNGRIVLSHAISAEDGEPGPAFLNLFSFAFRDRAKEASKLRRRFELIRIQAETERTGFILSDVDQGTGPYILHPPSSAWRLTYQSGYIDPTQNIMPRVSVIARMCANEFTATRTAIAIERYKQNHDRWPKSLDELVPDYLDAIPNDEFADEPLRYRLQDGLPFLYSVGENGIDNGGIERKLDNYANYDIKYLPAEHYEAYDEYVLVPLDTPATQEAK